MQDKAKTLKAIENFYYQAHEKYEQGICDDWEQVFFDNVEKALESDTREVYINLFYADDDSIFDTADLILYTLSNKTLIDSYCFEPYTGCIVAVCVVKK